MTAYWSDVSVGWAQQEKASVSVVQCSQCSALAVFSVFFSQLTTGAVTAVFFSVCSCLRLHMCNHHSQCNSKNISS